MGDKKTEPHPSGFEVVTPRGVQQWVGDSAGSASRAPGAFGSILGDVGDDHVRVHQDVEERSRVTLASHVADDEASSREDIEAERVPQRITYKIPSTFNLGQALLWISVSIGGHLSREHLEREIERWWSYNPKVEPSLDLVRSRLNFAHLDFLSRDQRPNLSAEVAFVKAGEQLLDALRGGKVKMWGEPSDPRNSAEFLSPYQCEQIFFSEEQYGAARAVTVNKPERFWTCLRFASSEIVDLWPVSEILTIDDDLKGVDVPVQGEEIAAKSTNGGKVEQSGKAPVLLSRTVEEKEVHPPEDTRLDQGSRAKAKDIIDILMNLPTDPPLSTPSIRSRIKQELGNSNKHTVVREIDALLDHYPARRRRGENKATLASRKSHKSNAGKSDTN